ncbi:MAG: ubiquinone/menaquinone biosynthesis methyltransferase [Bacteroidales bacterium]|nr:ubiquinone/menaquinone biosynthesis methyltransferase [Candidatus Latescibacterota bacterium]
MSKAEAQGKFLRKVYSRIAGNYELTNHAMTFGLDVLWRKKAARIAVEVGACRRDDPGVAQESYDVQKIGSCPGSGLWLDTCTGTGEMAVNLHELATKKAPENVSMTASGDVPGNVKVFGVDFSQEMLVEAKKKPDTSEIRFCGGDMDCLPFPDDTFSLVTMSFATRNNNPDRETLVHRFSEIHRVLKSGGLFVNVETSQPSSSLLVRLRNLFVKLYIPCTATVFTGDKKGYTYLAESIPRFYGAEELAVVLKESGFAEVESRKLMFGVSAVHVAHKR